MELDQLRHFVAVAKHRSFTRAATECHLSQPALSRSVQRLEVDLGGPLFERIKGRVSLTQAGLALWPRAQEILAITLDIRRILKDDGTTGLIRIGAIPTIAPYLLPGLIQSFVRRFPGARIQVREDVTARLLDDLEDGQLDVALMARPLPGCALRIQDIYQEELFLILPRGHVLVDRDSIGIADLSGHPMILLEASHCLTGNIQEICHTENLTPISIERANQISMVQELVSMGHGLSFIPRLAREKDSSPDRVYRSLKDPKPTRTVVSVHDPRRHRTRLVQEFDRHLATTIR